MRVDSCRGYEEEDERRVKLLAIAGVRVCVASKVVNGVGRQETQRILEVL